MIVELNDSYKAGVQKGTPAAEMGARLRKFLSDELKTSNDDLF